MTVCPQVHLDGQRLTLHAAEGHVHRSLQAWEAVDLYMLKRRCFHFNQNDNLRISQGYVCAMGFRQFFCGSVHLSL